MRRTTDRRRTSDRREAPRRTASAGSADSADRSSTSRPRRSQALAERVTGEPADADVLADRGDPLVDQLANRLVGVTERLVVQADLGEPLLELALDDLRPDVLGLLLDGLVAAELLALRLEVGFRDALGVDVERSQSGHLDREVADELLELVGAGDEVGLAVDLDQDADPAARVDVARDEAVLGVPIGPLGGGRQAAIPEDGDGLLDVAVGLDERLLAVHES